ncbi:MAG: V-type ATP synthase subunit D [Clostridiales bacterium]|nr:V-type ATP synthase subunit D [Clostridiales bacterium]
MAVLQVNPTRMELSRLKKRLATSRRGHKLLKDKRDDLMKKFLELIRENMELRVQLEDRMAEVYEGFVIAGASMDDAVLQESLMLPQKQVFAEVKSRNVMSVNVPDFRFTDDGDPARDIYPYGFAFTSGELDASVDALSEVLPLMLQLAQAEKTIQLLAEEIEKTRRRVNALEYVQIPTLQDTIKSITMKLDENERGNLARLMKIKDMMIAQQREASGE